MYISELLPWLGVFKCLYQCHCNDYRTRHNVSYGQKQPFLIEDEACTFGACEEGEESAGVAPAESVPGLHQTLVL